MNKEKEVLSNLPGIDLLLSLEDTRAIISEYGTEKVTFALRTAVAEFREILKINSCPPSNDEIILRTKSILDEILFPQLRKVINATGIIVHTNLGRAPLGKQLLEDAFSILDGYSNLEFDLNSGSRGNRNNHAAKILTYLTGAEDVMIVNNNAAAVMLILNTFAKDKQVVVSRSELIEIGGSFRIPDIMESSGCIMKEVGTTNKTSVADYENAISDNTGLLFKAHKSNYVIKGFTQEVSLKQLVQLGNKHKIPVVYDLGSGLLRRPKKDLFKNEPTVFESTAQNPDLLTFSGDKLIGGPQSGIIVGKKEYIEILKKQPLARALRVCKTTLALLEAACLYYMDEEKLLKHNQIFATLSQSSGFLKEKAENLSNCLKEKKIENSIENSFGQYGGGAMPDETIDSFSVVLEKQKNPTAKSLQMELLRQKPPVLSNLSKGCISLDVMTIKMEEIHFVVEAISESFNKLSS